jgi:hypothetical protein
MTPIPARSRTLASSSQWIGRRVSLRAPGYITAQKIHFVASKQVYPEFSPIAFEVQVFEAILGHQACVIISINGRTVQV